MSEEILKRYKIKAKKSLGQNFLINNEIIKNISNIIETENKNIIEVGPGYGALTQKLLEKKLESLTLIELDSDMIKILEDRINLGELNIKNTKFTINNLDILKYIPPFKGGLGGHYSVIANIPYYITSPILTHFLYKLENSPEEMVILMQKDVGDKILYTSPPVTKIITSPPAPLLKGEGSKKKYKSSVIGLMMAKKAYVSEELFVAKENFVPAPKVESSVLKFVKHNLYENYNDEIFLKFIKIGFSSARKKLIKNLVNSGLDKNKILDIFQKLDIDENIRAENIGIKKWCELSEELNKI